MESQAQKTQDEASEALPKNNGSESELPLLCLNSKQLTETKEESQDPKDIHLEPNLVETKHDISQNVEKGNNEISIGSTDETTDATLQSNFLANASGENLEDRTKLGSVAADSISLDTYAKPYESKTALKDIEQSEFNNALEEMKVKFQKGNFNELEIKIDGKITRICEGNILKENQSDFHRNPRGVEVGVQTPGADDKLERGEKSAMSSVHAEYR